jgi:hypothetical protein
MRKTLALSAAIFLAVGSVASAGTAIPANAFLKSIGIGGHIDQGYPEAPYEVPFKFTGIRNYRDGGRNISALIALHNNTKSGSYPGVMTNLLSWPDTVISEGTSLAAAGALMSFEGANEPNNFLITYNGATGGGNGTWLPVAQLQRDYYAAIKANATLKSYPVFSVSEGGAETNNVGLQFLTIPSGAGTLMPDGTHYADYANLHNYVDDHVNLVDNIAWYTAEPFAPNSMDGMYGEYIGTTWLKGFKASPANTILPRVTTETSWGTIGAGAASEAQQGRLFLDMYLSEFKRGWSNVFWYELHDGEGGDSTGEGIYRADWTAKPAATYMHNLTTVLADSTDFTPAVLNYSIPGEQLTVHDLLLQKSNGKFELIVWDDRPIGEGSDAVTVNFGATYATVNVYDTTTGVVPIKSLSNVNSVSLTLTDHPLIIEVSSIVGSGNVALNKSATSSSSYAASYAPKFAFDGILTTRWSSTYSDPQWVYVDLGSSYSISEVKLTWETAYGKAYQIQVSNDAINWTNIYSTTAGTGGVNDLTSLTGTGRYVRMYGTQRGTSWGYSLWEFEVYGH